jgi:hypothetical protein
MSTNAPITSGWQPCPHCYAHGWITRALVVRDDHVTNVWQCGNCRHEWPIEQGSATDDTRASRQQGGAISLNNRVRQTPPNSDG